MEEAASRPAPAPAPAPPQPQGDDLVKRLSQGDHSVEVGLRSEKAADAFRQAVDRGYVHIKFTQTRGGTELGVRLDRDATDLSRADFDGVKGVAHLVGDLTLDYVKVKCIADIDLETLSGKGHLEPVEAGIIC
jgi:hypothetical protein